MPGHESVKKYYLDASVLIKLVVDEPDCDLIRKFFYKNTNFCTTPMCLAEAIGVLKRKWDSGEITSDKYFGATRKLIINTWGNEIELDKMELLDPTVHSQVEQMAKKHSLDLSDAFQLWTILKGFYSVLVQDSSSVLITADRKLEMAAQSEKIRVWNCRSSEVPDWL